MPRWTMVFADFLLAVASDCLKDASSIFVTFQAPRGHVTRGPSSYRRLAMAWFSSEFLFVFARILPFLLLGFLLLSILVLGWSI